MADPTPVTLRDPSSALSAVYVPGAGMIATSLSDGGTELLGQRRGLDAYVSAGKTMGIPLLYPWANRLSAKTYDVDGRDGHACPGRLRGAPGQQRTAHPRPARGLSRMASTAGLRPRSSRPNWISEHTTELRESFPFPHLIELTVELLRSHADRQHHRYADIRHGGAAGVRISPIPAAARRAETRMAHRDG